MNRKPQIIVFDVDGVLVDVRRSFHASILATVKHFTGRRVARAEIQAWKNRSGYNDDWRLCTDWIASLGRRIPYEVVKGKFMEFYWGNGDGGFATREKWILPPAALARLSRRAELSIFTGRTRQEFRPTLEKSGAEKLFQRIVTHDDVQDSKPDPKGLLQILAGRDPRTALYLGDNIDDALASRAADIPFIAVLPRGSAARRLRGPRLRQLGAQAVFGHAQDLEKWLA